MELGKISNGMGTINIYIFHIADYYYYFKLYYKIVYCTIYYILFNNYNSNRFQCSACHNAFYLCRNCICEKVALHCIFRKASTEICIANICNEQQFLSPVDLYFMCRMLRTYSSVMSDQINMGHKNPSSQSLVSQSYVKCNFIHP